MLFYSLFKYIIKKIKFHYGFKKLQNDLLNLDVILFMLQPVILQYKPTLEITKSLFFY